LERILAKIHDSQYFEHKSKIYKLAFEILNDVKIEFSLNEDIFILLSISDFEFSEILLSYNKKLNSKTIFQEYTKWLNQRL
jgi:hypothetical protein